MRFKA